MREAVTSGTEEGDVVDSGLHFGGVVQRLQVMALEKPRSQWSVGSLKIVVTRFAEERPAGS